MQSSDVTVSSEGRRRKYSQSRKSSNCFLVVSTRGIHFSELSRNSPSNAALRYPEDELSRSLRTSKGVLSSPMLMVTRSLPIWLSGRSDWSVRMPVQKSVLTYPKDGGPNLRDIVREGRHAETLAYTSQYVANASGGELMASFSSLMAKDCPWFVDGVRDSHRIQSSLKCRISLAYELHLSDPANCYFRVLS